MRRYIFPLILTLVLALGCFGYGGYRAWLILDEQARTSSPEAIAAKRMEYEAALNKAALDPLAEANWEAEEFVWPKSAAPFFAAPDGFIEIYRYDTPEGFPILSDTAAWKPDSLKKVYEEMTKIKHGAEMSQLDAVLICSGAVKFEEDAEGEFVRDKHQVKLRFRLPGLLATASVFTHSAMSKTIWIREREDDGGARQFAYLLSHEYGHFFHYIHNAGQNAAIERTYSDAQKKLLGRSYIWKREEIEANDFATLMGSPGSFEKTPLLDVKQELAVRLKSGNPDKVEYRRVYSSIFNILDPLAYTLLAPASQVKGLAGAYYGLLPNPPAVPKIPAKLPKLSISGKGGAYTVSWTRPWTDKKAFYVLLCSSDEVNPDLKGTAFEGEKWHAFVCSRRGNEKGAATIGKASQRKGNTVFTLSDHFAKGTKTFRVFAVLPDNAIVVSEPLKHKFK